MNNKLLELYKEYNELCENTKLEYQPDGFLVMIHEHYFEKGKIKLPYPLYATWDITRTCNLHCEFCSASSLSNKGIVDDDKTLLIARKIIDNKMKYVSIRGGEPTLVKQLPEIIKLLVNNGIFVELVTNGFNINEKFLNKLNDVNKNLVRIKISLDCTKKEINDSIRGKGSFVLATKAIETCFKNNWPYRVQMVLTNKNKDDIENMYKYVSENGCTSFGVSIMLPMGRGIQMSKVEVDEELLRILINIKKNETTTKLEKMGMGIDGYKFYEDLYKDMNLTDDDAYKFSILKCNCAKTRINIDFNGDVYPCDMTKYNEFKLGNILENTVDEFWNCSTADRFNLLSRRTKKICKDCKIKGCNTGCFGMSYGVCRSIENFIPNCKLYDK